ncbi:hypothetical protein AA313_de0207062 [Arthrobotrys entomopaga]|nr:hypothetical protein AA313_de0207062 [Arthrobotrys entomopaga]
MKATSLIIHFSLILQITQAMTLCQWYRENQYNLSALPSVIVDQTFNGPRALGPPFEDKNHDCLRDNPRDEIWFTDPNRPYQTALRVVQHAEEIFKASTHSCTIFYNHNNTNPNTDPEIDLNYSRGSIFCEENYSIDLWFSGNGDTIPNPSDPSTQRNLTVDCMDNVVKVEWAILKVRSGEAYWRDKFDQPTDLIHDLTWLKNGCPKPSDKDYLERMVTAIPWGAKKPDRNHRNYTLPEPPQ